jgi:hypothetical protein
MSQRTLVEVVYADGSSFEQTFDSEAIVVGVGPEADLQIRRAPEIEGRHLLIMPRLQGLWISAAREARVRPLIGGAHFENGLVPWGTEIDVGSVTLRPRKPASGKKLRRWPLLLAAVPIAAFAYLAYWSQERLPRTSAQPPALFDGVPATCPDPQRPLVRAAEALKLADALESQYVYDPQKGIASASEFAVAEVCAMKGRNARLREEARTRRLSLEGRVSGDFGGHRVTLDRAIALDDASGIVKAARQLTPFLSHRPSEYGRWLKIVEQHVGVRVEKEDQERADIGKVHVQR